MLIESGEDQPLQHLDAGAEEGDRSVGSRLISFLPRFEEWYDGACLPDCRDLTSGDRDVEDFCQIFQTCRSEMLEMKV